jgi:hypothetical protein
MENLRWKTSEGKPPMENLLAAGSIRPEILRSRKPGTLFQGYRQGDPKIVADPAGDVTMSGGVLGNEHIAGMEAPDRSVGYFDLGDSRQVGDVLNAGSIVEVVHRRGWASIESGWSLPNMVDDFGKLVGSYVQKMGLAIGARIDCHDLDHQGLLPKSVPSNEFCRTRRFRDYRLPAR